MSLQACSTAARHWVEVKTGARANAYQIGSHRRSNTCLTSHKIAWWPGRAERRWPVLLHTKTSSTAGRSGAVQDPQRLADSRT
jgi:hypothetical protein